MIRFLPLLLIVALAAFLIRHQVAIGAFQVIQRGIGARAFAKSRMRDLVLDPLAADIDDAAVLDAPAGPTGRSDTPRERRP